MDDRQTAATFERVFFELRKVIVGQDRLLERLLVGVLSRGHCLLESVPGLAKTLAAETLANVVGGTFARVQFTPDLLPADILGANVLDPRDGSFHFQEGP
ncbi:MAG: AAA family ATPase, partial [Acidimicrobiia bacterium]|nr:AAA family ATPase [Acidimicrobiia bacterium]